MIIKRMQKLGKSYLGASAAIGPKPGEQTCQAKEIAASKT